MDFLALPRRDLQALCKRNGVRANMTNVAMADALRALPKIDGIEEYVKQPVPVREPVAKVAVAEEKNAGKQGNPLPRGRRVVAKSLAPTEPEEANEEEKENAKRQSSMEDAPEIGVGRRGASRRATLVPVVPQLAAMAEETLKRGAKREKAPAPVVGRRGASRRVRPSRAVAAQEAESEVAGAEEEQREDVEDLEREATMDDVPALGVGRRGASRRARPAPSVTAMAGKVVVEEEQRAQIGRCVRAKGTSSEPIALDDSDGDEMENAKPEEQQEAAQILGVCRPERASRRAPAPLEAPATRRSAAASEAGAGDVAVEAVPVRATRQRKPTMKAAAAAAEVKPPRRATRGAVTSTLLQQELQEEPQEAVGAPDMAVEAVPIRPTRQRKTMKAAAAATATAEEKAPPRATRRGAVMRIALQLDAQEKPQEAVGAPVSYQPCDALEELEKAFDLQKEELNKVDQPKQDEDQDSVIIEDEKMMEETPAENSSVIDEECMDKPEIPEQLVYDEKCHTSSAVHEESPILSVVPAVIEQASENDEEVVGAPISYILFDAVEELVESCDPQKEELNEVNAPNQDKDQDVVIIENEKLMEETPEGVFSDNKAVGAPVSYQPCDALEESEEAFDPLKDESNKGDLPKQDEDKDLVMIEDEKLMEETPAENSSVIDEECMDKPEMPEQLVYDEKCHTSSAIHEESPILSVVPAVIEQASENDGEVVGALISYMQFNALKELVDSCDPQKEDVNEMGTPKQDVVIIENKKQMEDTPAQEFTVTDQIQEDLEEAVGAPVSYQPCDALEELEFDPQKGEVNKVDAPNQDEDQDLGASFQDDGRSNLGLLDNGVCEETNDASEEMELVPCVQTLQAPLTGKNNSRKNNIEPMTVLEEKVVKVASESDDLTKLSLGQLRAKLKEKLNAKKNKEAKKRVALARVDENVCRSHAKRQQQDLNVQQH